MGLGAILALTLAGVASAGSPGERFAQGSDRGENPLASATGTTAEPHVMYAKIKTFPRGQRVGSKYRTDCAKGSRAGTRGDTFVATAPVRKKLRMRFDDPDLCHATILTRMKGNGTLKVVLRAKEQR